MRQPGEVCSDYFEGVGIVVAKPASPLFATKIRIGRGRSLPQQPLQAGHSSLQRRDAASIPKSRPEIKNRCTKEGVNRENLAAIAKLTP